MGTLDLFLHSSCTVPLLGTLVILLLVYIVYPSSFRSQAHRKEPPGPRPLALLGNLLQLDLKRLHNSLWEFSKIYGSVFTIYLGPKKVVVLAGYKTVKEALVNYAEEFGDRDPWRIMDEHNKGHGIVWSNGESWREMRRFASASLKDRGMGKRACEDKIIEECQYVIEVLKQFKGEAFDTTQPVFYAVSNIICSMIYGNRFEYDDPVFSSLIDYRHVELMTTPSIQIYNIFPWLGKWIANRREFHRLAAISRKNNLKMIRRLIETLDPLRCRGIVDVFLVQKQKLEESGITNSHYHNENLLLTVTNLFSAGIETTATTLRWGLVLMAKYPKIQDQVHEELSRVTGSRQVRVEDRKALPFTNAVIHEIQRLANIIPMSLPHRMSRDVIFQGHFIKKGTTVYPLLTSVLNDEREWERPHTFYPAHFLDKDGKFVLRDAFMPFSAGRRVCLGESLAKMELFIFLSTLLQNLRFTPPPGVSEDELDLTPHSRLSLEPMPHKLCAVPRM